MITSRMFAERRAFPTDIESSVSTLRSPLVKFFLKTKAVPEAKSRKTLEGWILADALLSLDLSRSSVHNGLLPLAVTLFV